MKKIELLAPAGGMEQYIAAVDAGADAVYIGGDRYSARAGAENFSLAEMDKAVDYGHLRDVKTYVALNTLVTDDMLPRALAYAGDVCALGADALIIQDAGLGLAVRETLPGIPLHLSTQATIFNREGVLKAGRMGYSRVIVARELSLDEIADCAGTGVDIEVFCHGALCLCYSGQCQMSRFMGGRSGNRGCCAQSCRLPYNGGYPLSARDLCTLPLLPRLIDTGAASLKIEGRMRSTAYVATVTSVYRKYVDLYCGGGAYSVDEKDIQDLLQVFNRGGFTQARLAGDPGKDIFSGASPKHTGVPAARVVSSSGGLAEVEPLLPLHRGDILESGSGSFTLTYMDGNTIGDLKRPAFKGEILHRLVSAGLSQRKLPERKVPVSLYLRGENGRPFTLTATDLHSGITVSAESEFIPQPSRSGRCGRELYIRQLKKSGGTPFVVTAIELCLPRHAYIPLSAVNSVRRKVLGLLAREKASRCKRGKITAVFPSWEKLRTEERKEYYCADIPEDVPEGYVPVLPLLKMYDAGISSGAVPCIPQVTRGRVDERIRENIEELAAFVRNSGGRLYVGNPGWIDAFAERGCECIGDFGLNICNGPALRAYGLRECFPSLELMDLKTLGKVPLMVTEHPVATGPLTDRKGVTYEVCDDGERRIIKGPAGRTGRGRIFG